MRELPKGYTYSKDGDTVYFHEDNGHVAWSTSLFWRMFDDMERIANAYHERIRKTYSR